MSPVSKVRRKHPTGAVVDSRERDLAAQRAAYRRRERLRRVGYVIMLLAAGLAAEHAAAHLGAFGKAQPPPIIDLTLGWPLAGLLFVVGALFAGQRR